MSVRIQSGGFHQGDENGVVRVPTLLPTEISAEESRKGTAGCVRMPSGAVILVGGEAFKNALRNGGVVIDENGNPISTATKMESTINGAPGPRVIALG